MLELILANEHETSKLFEWLEPREILQLTCANRTLHRACENWCQTEGVPGLVAVKRSEIARICSFLQDQVGQNQGHPFEFHGPRTNSDLNTEVPSLFESYHGFLEALLRTPLNDRVVNLPSWSKRYWMVSQPRPRAIPQRFDYGYPQTGYWCDAFGCGAPNDFFRLVGDHPTTFYSLCLAGSDAHHILWRNASNNDRTNDPVSMEESEFSYTQTSYQGTEWDETRRYWGKCGARVRRRFRKIGFFHH